MFHFAVVVTLVVAFKVVVTVVVSFKVVIIVGVVLDNDVNAVVVDGYVFVVDFVFVDVVVVVADVINNPRYPMQTSDILSVPRETSS